MVRRDVFSGGDTAMSIPRLLFALLGAPVLWALHLAASYFVLTLDCISRWNGAPWALALLTLLLAGGAAVAGWTAWRDWRALGPKEADPEERHWIRFLLIAGMGASVLFTLVIIAEGVAPAFVNLCP